MRLELPKFVTDKLPQDSVSPPLIKENLRAWGGEQVVVDTEKLLPTDFPKLVKAINEAMAARKGNGNRGEVGKLKGLRTLLLALVALQDGKELPVKRLDILAEALLHHLESAPRHFVFARDEDSGVLLPWMINGIQYHEAVHHQSYVEPAHTDLYLRAWSRGHVVKSSYRWERSALGEDGCTVAELLTKSEVFPADSDKLAEHDAEVERYFKIRENLGEQFKARGPATDDGDDDNEGKEDRHRWWGEKTKRLGGAEGAQANVIMDDTASFGKDVREVFCRVWANQREGEDSEDFDEGSATLLPVHPEVRVFDLTMHRYFKILTNFVSEYVYDDTAAEKLILPKTSRQITDILVDAALGDRLGGDLVRGKSGGVCILCYGIPGTGKTLTAEVYAETKHRPLYSVQCSQLGLDVDNLETNLKQVLCRAEKWHAILLLDEADVYIRKRGESVEQNAIVGVFLRVLEYFSGILFMTTNRDAIVDDAVISRCIAQIEYTVPETAALRQALWKVQLTNYKFESKPAYLAALDKLFPKATGRTVKQLCRLTRLAYPDMKVPEPDAFDGASTFMPLALKSEQ